MAISDEWRRLALFVCSKNVAGEAVPVGTGFLVAWELKAGGHLTYAVTNRHIIEAPGRSTVYLRVNTKRGAPEDVPVSRWRVHPKDDIAVTRVDVSDDHFDTISLPYDRLAAAGQRPAEGAGKHLYESDVGVGAQVFYAGLFSRHPGKSRILPVLRFGSIALLPSAADPVPMEWPVAGPKKKVSLQAPAYLMEARSWRGFSGSPVCMYDEFGDRIRKFFENQRSRELGAIGLIGVVSHFWDYGEAGKDGPHAGLVTVSPASSIRDVLTLPEFAAERDRLNERGHQENVGGGMKVEPSS